MYIYGNEGFVEVSKNLDTNLRVIFYGPSNNYVERSNWCLKCLKLFVTFYIIILIVQQNYFQICI